MLLSTICKNKWSVKSISTKVSIQIGGYLILYCFNSRIQCYYTTYSQNVHTTRRDLCLKYYSQRVVNRNL